MPPKMLIALNHISTRLYQRETITKIMRSFSFITFLLLSIISYGQTAVISNKSHAGDLAQINKEPDNFGEMAPRPVYDTIMLVGEDCVVEIGTRWGNSRFHDTICNHWSLEQRGYTLKSAMQFYGSNPQFIGFKDSDSNDQDYWHNGGSNQNNLIGFFVLILLSFGAYLITPILKKK